MIVQMTKYDLVVFHRDKDAFLERLQELGLVDITTTGWEPGEEEHRLLASIDRHRSAVARLRAMAAKEGFVPGVPYATGQEAWDAYTEAAAQADALDAQIAAARKEADELRVWGEFDPAALGELQASGVVLRYYSVYTRDFDDRLDGWKTQYDIVPLAEQDGTTWFVVITSAGQEVAIDAQELKAPTTTAADREREAERLEDEKAGWTAVLARAAASIDLIKEHGECENERLHLSQVANSATDEAEGTLVVMEGWATRETADKVDAMLAESPGIYYIKSKPSPHDNVPVKLKNKRLSSPFELIGSFYSLPKYGTMDLTAFFGPFYMVFFGFCLGDAGYGLLLLIGGLVLGRMARRKESRPLAQVANLTMLCGGAAVVFGFLAGSFFGVALSKLTIFDGFKDKFFGTDMLFVLALGLGVVQILFALVLRIAGITRQFGFKYSLGVLGWFMMLCGLIYVVLPKLHGMFPVVTIAYPVDMNIFYIVAGIGGALMLFFHNPEKNPLANFGGGLWNTYNDVTGFLGDFLSYIRLFALCLSGGTLALVFNDLAFGMTADMPVVVSQLVAVVILVFGHAINLFMSALGAFVHPMRLTFVEFYKNAGFESSQREFTPLKKANNLNK